jgi:hypothetical protein
MDESTECFKVTMFFPLRDNEGNVFDEDTWEWWIGEITRIVSGFTDLGVVAGWWHGHSDQNRWIMAVVRSEEEVNELRDFVQVAGKRFRQDTMYFEWHTVHFELVK